MLALHSVTLEAGAVRLLPLRAEHAPALEHAGSLEELHRIRVTWVPGPGEGREYVERALSMQAAGTRWPWVIEWIPTGELVGSTSFHDIVPAIDRLEIGHTWVAKPWQRTVVNTQCKLLLMQHAFEVLGAALVGWRTGAENLASQAAIERLGAHKDGVLRHHFARRDGFVRDTVMYSMAAAEWPAAKRRITASLLTR
jgi:RimJ/RimL family protein N-acetyltransferase